MIIHYEDVLDRLERADKTAERFNKRMSRKAERMKKVLTRWKREGMGVKPVWR